MKTEEIILDKKVECPCGWEGTVGELLVWDREKGILICPAKDCWEKFYKEELTKKREDNETHANH